MIQLNKVNINFDRPIISNGSINIPKGKITVIMGESGCGKTTLLYMLGLLSSNSDYEYFYNGKAIDLNEQYKSRKLAREDFGFLFQDHSLIDSLTIHENIVHFAKLSGYNINENEVNQLLREVDIKIDSKKTYPRQLSGGEQQRAALASILAKKPKCIFADEPTSALDKKNTEKIISIFKSLASKGMTIVIATHSDEIANIADYIYNIEELSINLSKHSELDKTEEKSQVNKNYRYGIQDIFNYSKGVRKKSRVLKGIITFFCALAITGYSLSDSVMESLQSTQKDLLDQISDREIFTVNLFSPTIEKREQDGNLIIGNEDYNKLISFDGIDEVYPLYEFRSFAFDSTTPSYSSEIKVITDKETYEQEFSLDSETHPYFIVLPYNENQMLERQTDVNFNVSENDENPLVYLSHELADLLNIHDDVSKLSIDCSVAVPVRKYEYEQELEDGFYNSDLDISEYCDLSLSVAGILDEDIINHYTINGDCIIYAPSSYMDAIQKKISDKYKNEKYSEYSEEFVVKEWLPSAYLVYVDSYKSINNVKGKIENINPSMTTICAYQDTEILDKALVDIKKTTTIILSIILGIIFFLMSAVFISITLSRKREIAILKANGMTNINLIKLTFIESIVQGFGILLISTTLSFVLSAIGSKLLLAEVSFFSFNTFITILCTSLLFVLLPTTVSIALTLKVQPDKILRN